jgi:hypothetical protein
MRKLNCRPGDLAITVDAYNPVNIGSIVRVLHKHHNQSALIVDVVKNLTIPPMLKECLFIGAQRK